MPPRFLPAWSSNFTITMHHPSNKEYTKVWESFSSSSFVFVQIYARYPSWERMLVTVSFLVDQLNGHDTPYDQYFYIMF